MTKIVRPVIPIDVEKHNWKLVRESDGLTRQSEDVNWVEFNEDGTFKDKHNGHEVGLSLLMSPFNQFFAWQTTPVTEIVEERDGYVKFRTENSVYELTWIDEMGDAIPISQRTHQKFNEGK